MLKCKMQHPKWVTPQIPVDGCKKVKKTCFIEWPLHLAVATQQNLNTSILAVKISDFSSIFMAKFAFLKFF